VVAEDGLNFFDAVRKNVLSRGDSDAAVIASPPLDDRPSSDPPSNP
jgi:hypothetical protein